MKSTALRVLSTDAVLYAAYPALEEQTDCWPVHSGAQNPETENSNEIFFKKTLFAEYNGQKVKVAHTRLSSVRFRSRSRFLAVSMQVT